MATLPTNDTDQVGYMITTELGQSPLAMPNLKNIAPFVYGTSYEGDTVSEETVEAAPAFGVNQGDEAHDPVREEPPLTPPNVPPSTETELAATEGEPVVVPEAETVPAEAPVVAPTPEADAGEPVVSPTPVPQDTSVLGDVEGEIEKVIAEARADEEKARHEIETEISDVRGEVDKVIPEIEADIKNVEGDINKVTNVARDIHDVTALPGEAIHDVEHDVEDVVHDVEHAL